MPCFARCWVEIFKSNDDSDDEETGSEDESDNSSDPEEDDVADVGEEAGRAVRHVKNPLYEASGLILCKERVFRN